MSEVNTNTLLSCTSHLHLPVDTVRQRDRERERERERTNTATASPDGFDWKDMLMGEHQPAIISRDRVVENARDRD